MPAPGQFVLSAQGSPSRGLPTSVSRTFAAGLFEQGPANGYTLCRSMSDVINKMGARLSFSTAYDWCEDYFNEGGKELYLSRVLGTGFKTAELIVKNGAEEALKIKAKTPGEWANGPSAVGTNGISVQISVPSGEKIIIKVFQNGELKEESPELATQKAAKEWSEFSKYLTIEVGTGVKNPTVLAETALAGGADIHASVSETNWEEAIAAFISDLGPGQLVQIGRTTKAAHQITIKAAAETNRFAVLACPDTHTVGTLTTLAAELRAGPNARYGGLFAPWVTIPGITPGTTRSVDPTALVCGKIAKTQELTKNSNEPAAGANGIAEYSTGLSQAPWSEKEREELNKACVNVIKNVNGIPTIYGWRTLVSSEGTKEWLNMANQRLYMSLAAKCAAAGQQFVFKQIDGRGKTTSSLASMLTGILLPHFENGSLYGASPAEAFNVQTGPNVNTTATAENQELLAIIALKMSEDAELVYITLVKTAITGSVN
jgi:phage tail sheath protein FI